MDMDSGGKGRDEEQDGMSVHSPCKAPLSSASSLPKAFISLSRSICMYMYMCCKLDVILINFMLN